MGIPHGIFNKSEQPTKCFFWVTPMRALYDLFWVIDSMKEQKPDEVVALAAEHEPVDPTIPRSYAPFGIQAIGSKIYVTYAKTQPGSDDEVAGAGLGFVDAFDAASGRLAGKVAFFGALNAPWGLAQAPEGFGRFGGDLLVGNFGDGRINAYRPIFGGLLFLPEGPLRTPQGAPLWIDGLWALEFGNGAAAGPAGTLFFTAGPNDESNGLFGMIAPG